ncbi:glucosaminidase domain-containing protein [Actinokineospora alba]|nr:glucosaminidase domain-containing protein [Actinokineospora alba]
MRATVLALALLALWSVPAAAEDATDEQYLAAAMPAARAVAAEFAIPASVTAAQSIVESGWGRSPLATKARNYFGYKCKAPGVPGPIAVGCVEHPTTECTPDCHPAVGEFRVYASMTDSFRDYGRHLSTSPYYAAALPLAADPDAFITEVAKRYATDPHYAEKVIRVMRTHDLYRLDIPQ